VGKGGMRWIISPTLHRLSANTEDSMAIQRPTATKTQSIS